MKKEKETNLNTEVIDENNDLSAKEGQKNKKPRNKKTIIIVCPVLTGGLVVGAITGGVIARVLKPEKVVWDDVDLSELEEDTSDLLVRYEKCKEENKEPSEVFTLGEICNIGALKFQAQDNTLSLGFGYAAAVGNVACLDVRNTCIRNGDNYFEESISKSSSGVDVKVAERAYQDPDGTTRVHEATFAKGANAEHPTWKEDYKTWEKEPYRENYGKYVDTLGIYIVSDKTIILGNNTTIVKDEEGYTLTMEMDPVKTVPRYVRRMHALSNSDVSKFFYVTLEYRLDLDLNLRYSYVHEQYAARLGEISAKTTGRMITYYYTDKDYMIPELKTPIDYDMKGEKLPKE